MSFYTFKIKEVTLSQEQPLVMLSGAIVAGKFAKSSKAEVKLGGQPIGLTLMSIVIWAPVKQEYDDVVMHVCGELPAQELAQQLKAGDLVHCFTEEKLLA